MKHWSCLFNVARFLFLDPRAADFYLDWELMARNQVALLRRETGRDPAHPDLIQLIGELSTHSKSFRTLWAAHDVRGYREGLKQFHHPVVGNLEFTGSRLTSLPLPDPSSSPTPSNRKQPPPRQWPGWPAKPPHHPNETTAPPPLPESTICLAATTSAGLPSARDLVLSEGPASLA